MIAESRGERRQAMPRRHDHAEMLELLAPREREQPSYRELSERSGVPVPTLGYLRLQAETAALICLFRRDETTASEWVKAEWEVRMPRLRCICTCSALCRAQKGHGVTLLLRVGARDLSRYSQSGDRLHALRASA